VNGDYEDLYDFDEADVCFLIPEARRSVDRVAALLPPPAAIHDAIHALEAEHSPLTIHEIMTTRWVRFGHRPSTGTVKRVLASIVLPLDLR